MRRHWKIAAFGVIAGAAIAAMALFQPSSGAILISDAAAQPFDVGGRRILAVTATIDNRGAPDRLVSVASPAAPEAMLYGAALGAGLAIPGADAASLAADGAHIMLFELDGPADEGRLVPLTLTFEKAGPVRLKAKIATPAPQPGAAAMSHAMHGAALHLSTAAAPPRIAVAAAPEGAEWRVSARVENFTFAPDRMDGPHVEGEGHGHLYLNGLKLQRMTGPEARIGALPPGEHVIRVSLNTNDHAAYAVDGRAVAAEVVVTVD